MYAKLGEVEKSLDIFNNMNEHNEVSWNVMISGFTINGLHLESFNHFLKMMDHRFTPDMYSVHSVLKAVGMLGDASSLQICIVYSLSMGSLHGLVYKTSLDTDNCVNSALIDMYSKCGSITMARKVFDCIFALDVVSWTAMISGYAQQGSVADALQLFRRMEKLNVRATAVTLLCILFACSHAGMVEEGLEYFYSMKEKYDLEPEMEHYACIVDLLGRVGRIC